MYSGVLELGWNKSLQYAVPQDQSCECGVVHSCSRATLSLPEPSPCHIVGRALTCPLCLCVCVVSVKYEDPRALGGLASALDVRQQNATGGVSAPKHAGGCSLDSHPTTMKCRVWLTCC